uniref:Uncharacterized protein n=1 Tax=[Tolypothrix] sp. PCC 7415 TaxID=373957 RepID=A0A2P0ZGB9_9CYAN|nr:hypothetical protein [[Tolypothrix] sp. PCC 7415]
MQENSAIDNLEGNINEVENLPLLPRSAWNSQLTYLKVLYKTKQALDKRQKKV